MKYNSSLQMLNYFILYFISFISQFYQLNAPLFFISKMIKIQKNIFLFLIMASISEQNQQQQASYSPIQLQKQQLKNNIPENISVQRQIQQPDDSTFFSEQANKIYIRCLQQLKESYSFDKKISCKTFKLFQKLFVEKIGNFDIKINPTAKQIRAYHTFMLKKFGKTDKIIQQLSRQGVYQSMKQTIQKKFNRKRKPQDLNILNRKALPLKGLMQRFQYDQSQKKPGTITVEIKYNLIKALIIRHARQCFNKGEYTLDEKGQKIFPNMKLSVICHIPIKCRNEKQKLQKQFQKLNLQQK